MRVRFLGARLFLLMAACLLATAMLNAQAVDSNLIGSVSDSSGAAVPNATVVALNVATGVKYTASTNTAGEYRVNNLPVGQYDVSATANGFSAAKVTNVALDLNHTASINLTLQVGAVSTTVEVSAAAALIDTSSSQLETTFTTNTAEDLGVAASGAGIWNLSLLGAGVASSGGIGQGTGPSIAGQRPENNTFSVDGVVNDNHYVTGPQVTIPNDAVQEFSLLQNQFSPEFGGASGGVFNLIVKSGTNTIHGSVYEYLQNRDLNALDQQQRIAGLTSQPRYDYNRLGATVGGPIIKNKLFYFGDFEYDPLGRSSVPTGEVDAPTAAGYSALAGISGLNATNLSIFKKYVPAAPVADGSTVVSGVTIPFGALLFNSPNYSNTYNAVVAVDFNMSDKDQFRARYVYNNYQGLDSVAELPVFYESSPNVNKSGSFSEFHNFSPTFQNELRASYSRNNANTGAGSFKFPGLDVFPNLSFDDLSLQLGPDPNTPSGSIENLSTLQDNVTKTIGQHTIKFGYAATDVILAGFFIQRARGDYDYASLEEYLLDANPSGGGFGTPNGGERTTGSSSVPFGFLMQAAYANDDYRIRPNLTLNLGLRWDWANVPVGSRYQAASAIASVPGVINFAAPKGSGNDWSPRLGFAYSPGKSGVWSIRGGVARSYDNTYINLNQNASPAYFATTLDCSGEAGVGNSVCPATGFLASGGLHSTGGGGGWTNAADARAAVSSYTFDMTKRPYAMTGTIGVQRMLAKDYTIEARYVYTKGVHLWNQTRLNIISPVTPTNYLPTFVTAPPSFAGLTNTLGQLQSIQRNTMAQYGLTNNIVGYHPWGNSRYNGLALQMNKRYSNNFQYIAAFTWSHAEDDSTATNFSTIFSPRRAQDYQNMAAEWANSGLDHRLRFTFTPIYDFKPFQHGNWFLKNLVGNWNMSATYTYESPEYATVQSGVDANLNGDSLDRSIINMAGATNIGSGVTPYNNAGQSVASLSAPGCATFKAAGQSLSTCQKTTVAYVANNAAAHYIVAGAGALSNSGRNTMPLGAINNVDANLQKRFNISERMAFSIGIGAFNIMNHPQFTGGYLSDVGVFGTNAIPRNFLVPNNADFGRYDQYVPSNARTAQVVAKFIF
ncbi:MAG TPA: TonB-dependent receptor [Bryobacteraceae bacterium]|nr:TonB-dependent receptor [Bryobacteraceae bacterium]